MQAGGRFAPGARGQQDDDDDGEDFYDEDDDSLSSQRQHHDRIRRNYLQHGGDKQQTAQQTAASSGKNVAGSGEAGETIHVTLNESYFAREQRALINLVANIRQKLHSTQMFNPAKNQSIREQQQQGWTEDEKYTLDSLNEIKGDEQFQWSRPDDGRNVWASKTQYFLAITSYSIGLGNVIRFPILVQKNGGLAFIIPFVIMLIVEGIPLFYLELAVGQRMRKAAISCWNLVSPFAAGIGIASAAVSFVIGLYYNTMVAWTLIYLWGSATHKPLPFTQCPAASSANSGASSNNNSTASPCQITGPFQHYWYRETLNASEDVSLWTNFNWPVFLCLLVAWLISYVCLLRGLTSSKRVVYVASTFPYVILTVFFFKATTLDGMSAGVSYLFEPEWSKLADPYVWLQSAAQVFFSLGLGFGGLIALSSYNQVNNNCYRDAVRVSLVNFGTSLYAGIVIFSILGYKAQLSYNKCLVQREQTIDYYLSDYNLKVIDYGAVFTRHQQDQSGTIAAATAQSSATGSDSNSNSTSSSSSSGGRQPNMSLEQLEGSSSDYYDASDAIDSIRSLDRQLDSVSDSGSFDYGDSDTEFLIDASSLISKSDLDKIVDEIPGLPRCSIRHELDQASQGPGLVFVVMAEAISQFRDAPLWAFAFFLMLLALGLDSQFGNLEGLLSSLADLKFVNNSGTSDSNCTGDSTATANGQKWRKWITGLICSLSLVISVVMFAHGAGSYMFAIFDEYAGSFSLVLIAIFELLAISHIYGLKRFCDDCELMTGKRPPFIILLSWRYISPILLLIVILATIKDFSVTLTYEAWLGDHLELRHWPSWCVWLAIWLILACVVWIPAVAVLRYFKISVIPEESLSQCWFPAEELREYHDLQDEHKVTKLERVLFGFRSDDD